MKTNLSKKELSDKLLTLNKHVQEVGATVGNPELSCMTNEFVDRYAEFKRKPEELLNDLNKFST